MVVVGGYFAPLMNISGIFSTFSLLKSGLSFLPLNSMFFYMKSEPLLWVIDALISYTYGSSFFEIPDKMNINDDCNVYVDVEKLYTFLDNEVHSDKVGRC